MDCFTQEFRLEIKGIQMNRPRALNTLSYTGISIRNERIQTNRAKDQNPLFYEGILIGNHKNPDQSPQGAESIVS